jgi:CRISPR-associated protein Csm4
MKLIRFRLKPKTAWMGPSPWQADTIAGLLAVVYARATTPERAAEDLIEPWRRGEPTLVVSDAFPGDLLPAPANLATLGDAPAEPGKKDRRPRWLNRTEFGSVQLAKPPFVPERDKPFREVVRMRNVIDRVVNSTGESGNLYEAAGEMLRYDEYLTIYARVEEGREQWAAGLFGLLAESGYGADAPVGAGEVEMVGGPEAVTELEPADATGGWVSLSTFQPAKADPTEGYWRSFVKYGKLGPDFAVGSVFKYPQWMLRAGACFRDEGPRREWYGRWIPGKELLPETARRDLEAEGIQAGQPAYALAVPLQWKG